MSYIWDYTDAYEYMRRVENADMPPVIITVAVTGGSSGKEVNPALPELPEEQAQAALEAYQAGACMVHLHARNETGAETSIDPARFRAVNKSVREMCPDIIIGNSTGVSPWVSREGVVRILEAEPEVCSLTMGPSLYSLTQKKRQAPLQGRPNDITREGVSAVPWQDIELIARTARQKDIKPELEITSTTTLWQMQRLIQENLLSKPYWMQLIFSPRNEFPTPEAVLKTVGCLPPDSIFSIIGLGAHELPLITLAILLGGHVRVGLEDNLFYHRGEPAVSNAQLVARAVRIAKEFGRGIATPAQARRMLGISPTPRQY